MGLLATEQPGRRVLRPARPARTSFPALGAVDRTRAHRGGRVGATRTTQRGVTSPGQHGGTGLADGALRRSAVAGSGVSFLMNNLGFFRDSRKVSDLAASVPDNGGCIFVTAFSGLFAPYWIDDAQGTICKSSL